MQDGFLKEMPFFEQSYPAGGHETFERPEKLEQMYHEFVKMLSLQETRQLQEHVGKNDIFFFQKQLGGRKSFVHGIK